MPIPKMSLLGGLCLLASNSSQAAGQSSANFVVQRDTINAGTAEMASANFRLAASVGDSISTGTINSVSFQLVSGFRAQVSATQAVLNLLSVVSRKMHGATPFELTINHVAPLTGAITVEPRAIGGGYTLVFHFDGPVNSVGAATALDAMLNSAGTATPVHSGNDVIVTLTNVADNKRLTVTLNGLNSTGTAMTSIGFLVGDMNSSKSVNAADISAVKAMQGKPVNSDANAKFDLNADGAINQQDVSAAKARSGLTIP